MHLQGHRAGADQHVGLGCLPKLESYRAYEVLELTPATLHDIVSLRALQVQPEPLSPVF